MPKKQKHNKKKELTSSEKLQRLIKEKKILARPILEGTSEADEAKVLSKKQAVDGYITLGISQGITFSDDPESRVSNWHRVDMWCVVQANPNHIDEVYDTIDDYIVDKLTEKMLNILDE